MSAIHTKSIGATGADALVGQTVAFSMKGQDIDALAVDATAEPIVTTGSGFIVVTNLTNESSAIFSIHQAAGVSVLTKTAGSALINASKDNASTLNVYVETGVVTIQNKLAAASDINIKAYI